MTPSQHIEGDDSSCPATAYSLRSHKRQRVASQPAEATTGAVGKEAGVVQLDGKQPSLVTSRMIHSAVRRLVKKLDGHLPPKPIRLFSPDRLVTLDEFMKFMDSEPRKKYHVKCELVNGRVLITERMHLNPRICSYV